MTPWLLMVLAGLLLGLSALGFFKSPSRIAEDDLPWPGDDLYVLALLVLAIVVFAVFVAAILLGPR